MSERKSLGEVNDAALLHGRRNLSTSTLDKPLASVVIPTKDRKEELSKAIQSTLVQTVSVEIVVMDDGSSDGTAKMVQSKFPMVRYFRLAEGKGPSFQRNRGIEIARASIVFPIDDDSEFVSKQTVEQTLAEFDHPRVGAVGIPYINVRQDPKIRQRAPESCGMYVTDRFVGAAHAVRRDVFLNVGGYREDLFILGEEGDLCLRMLAAGYITRLGRADPIHHSESLKRDFQRMDFYGRRNDILFAWDNVPMPFLPLHMLGTTINGLRFALQVGRFIQMLRGTINGWRTCLTQRRNRHPVDSGIYLLSRRLKKHGLLKLSEIEPLLPPLGRDGHDNEISCR